MKELKFASEDEALQFLSNHINSKIIISNEILTKKVKSLLSKLAKKAQEVYDAWDEENIDEYAGGGICHIIANELSDILYHNNIDSDTMSLSFKQHVVTIAYDIPSKTLISIDLPEYIYETGGGFSWKKIEDVKIAPSDFIIEELEWSGFFNENDELIEF